MITGCTIISFSLTLYVDRLKVTVTPNNGYLHIQIMLMDISLNIVINIQGVIKGRRTRAFS